MQEKNLVLVESGEGEIENVQFEDEKGLAHLPLAAAARDVCIKARVDVQLRRRQQKTKRWKQHERN